MGFEDLLAPLDWGRQGLVNTGEGLSSLLGGDFSRQNLAKIMPGVAGLGAGLLTGGTMAAPAAALTMALTQGLGKQFNPQHMQAQTTQDLVAKLGGDPESTWQNLGVGVATDPFTYAGLGMGAGLAGAGKASRIASAASGVGTGEAATEAGLGAAGRAGASGGRLGEMLGLRRGIGKVHFNPTEGVISPGAGRFMGNPELEQFGNQIPNVWGEGQLGLSAKTPAGNVVGLLEDPGVSAELAKQTRRHEIYHGLLGEALDTGKTAGLSPVQKAAHYLQSTAAPTGTSPRAALSVLLDETGAHGVGAGATPLSQLKGAGSYLFSGRGGPARQFYGNQLREISPSVGALYDALGYAPEAAKVGGLGAAGAGAYLGGRQLFGR